VGELGRRTFLKAGGAATASVLFGGTVLQGCGRGSSPTGSPVARRANPYGELVVTPDQDGLEVFELPKGFSYVTFGAIGSLMSDGVVTPGNLDGMAAFAAPSGLVRLVRNHENGNEAFSSVGGLLGPESSAYDRAAYGGTTTLEFDPVRRVLVRDFVSLNGTRGNCSGGHSYDGDHWFSCEETIAGPEQRFEKKHGYCYLVSASADDPVLAEPLTAMGRFSHEAVAADPATGYVYETEDPGTDRAKKCGLYRFAPVDPLRPELGGVLSMLAIRDIQRYDTTVNQKSGAALPVTWVQIDDPDPDLENGADTVFEQGWAKGAARFARLEGVWFDAATESLFVTSTTGGNSRYGQIWRYEPRSETLTLFFESPGGSVLDCPDSIVVTPRAGVLLCEDDATGIDVGTGTSEAKVVNRLVGLTPAGQAFDFAINRLNDAELSGACFSPDGQTLFVNVYGKTASGTGMTCAITGPWEDGPL
jgi:secreted PhoX family phosphatase